jgi:6-phosphogluconate dehydrogenase
VRAQAYDVLRTLGGLTNAELAAAFSEWNQSELSSFLVEISAIILAKKDDAGEGYLLDRIVDSSGSKGTGGRHGVVCACARARVCVWKGEWRGGRWCPPCGAACSRRADCYAAGGH